MTNQYDFPDKKFADKCWTHDINELVGLAGLAKERDADAPRVPANQKYRNWETVKDWNEHQRYERKSQAAAEALYQAITDPNDGVLPWIKQRW